MPALTPRKNDPAADVVYTPDSLAREIIEHFPLEGRVLDPARGGGAFYNHLPNTVSRLWCEIEEGRSFYDFSERVDWIVSNPPWSHMRAWIEHSCSLADNIVLLSTLTHFCTKARLRAVTQRGFGLREFFCVRTPRLNWPQTGFQLGAMHIQKDYSGPLALTGALGG